MPQPFVIRPRASSIVPGARAALRPDLDAALGPLAEHCADPLVTDLFVNGSSGLFVDRGSGAERVPGWAASEREVRDLAVALIGAGGRHLDDQSPCVDVRLSSGIRVHAVLSPV
jgi:pilus assembly protein CpaF